jgi:hypothetical protein
MTRPVTAFSATRAQVFWLNRTPCRRIVVEPVPRGLWRLAVRFADGSYAGAWSEAEERDTVVALAESYSRATGLPAFFQNNVHKAPVPMCRKGKN